MFRFESPLFLYLLFIVPIIIFIYIFSLYRRKRNILKFGDKGLIENLMPNNSSFRQNFKFIIVLVCFIISVFLLARPQFGSKTEKIKRKGVEVIIALDISNSMMAEDVAPNRIERSKRFISRLIDNLNSDKVGLVVFAGTTYTQVPITSDYLSTKFFLENISPKLIAKQGTNIADAIKVAKNNFTSKDGVGRMIVLITDGENHEPGAIEAVNEAVKDGIQVNVLGIGSTKGAPIPSGKDDYLKDREGNIVVSHLNESMCQQLAKNGNGIFTIINNTNSADKAIAEQIDRLSKNEVESNVYSEFNEQFIPLAWIVLFLLIADAFIMNKKNKRFKNIRLFS